MTEKRKSRYLYDHGLPFSQCLADDVLTPISTKKRGIGCLIIDGVPGSGKTTLAVHCGDFMQGWPVKLELGDHPQLAMGGKSLIEQTIICNKRKLSFLIYDEAGDFSKRQAISTFNKHLINFFEKCRALRINIVICLPNVGFLDNALFGIGVIDGLIHCGDKYPDCTAFGVYDTESLGWLRYQASKWPYHQWKAYNIVRPYERGYFLQLPPKRDRQLDALSTGDKVASIKKQAKAMEEREK